MKTVSALLLIATLTATACSSSSLEEDGPSVPSGTPLLFSTPYVGSMATRATEALASDFLVSGYKSFGATGQQTVMEQYQALYSTDAWGGTGTKWSTVGTTSDGFYKQQYVKYWDLSAFPYNFIALAPAPIKDGKVMDGFSVTYNDIKLEQTLQSQTASDGEVTPSAPATEYLLAQMQRQTNTSDATTTDDVDLLSGKTIGTGGDSPTKAVPLPFHHLSAKVRFGIFTTMPTVETQSVKIKNVTIKAKSANAEGFVTGAGSYAVDLSQTGVSSAFDGTFSGKTYQTDELQLLSFSGPTDNKFTDAYLEKHEWNSTTDLNAYYFECSDGLLEVPQNNVQLFVSFTLQPSTGNDYTIVDYPLTITQEDGTEANLHTWRPSRLYTYYIKIARLFSYDISFTATVSDWEDLEGSISTNLEK